MNDEQEARFGMWVDARPERCPRCGSDAIAEVVFGVFRMTPEMQARVERNEIIVMGCLVMGKGLDPKWMCTNCDMRFRLKGDAPD